MNANQIINMILKIFMRKAITKGVNMGISAASGARRPQSQAGNSMIAQDAPENAPQEKKPLTQEEKNQIRQARRARQAARQAKQAMKVTRRVTRM